MEARLIMLSLVLSAVWGCEEPVPTCEQAPELCKTHNVSSRILQKDLNLAYDLVYIPDGYTEEELPQFHRDVEVLIKSLKRTTVYFTRRHPDLFNHHIIPVASPTSNTTNDDRDDTVLGGYKKYDAINPSSSFIGIRDEHARKLATLAPDADVIVAVVKGSPWRANAYTAPNGPSTVVLSDSDVGEDDGTYVHELGHALFNLGDEYTEVNQCGVPAHIEGEWNLVRDANVTLEPEGDKWRHILPEHVEALEGGARFSQCVYHPAPRCKMNASHDEFCAVCAAEIEAVIGARLCGHEYQPPRAAIVKPASGQVLTQHVALELATFEHSALAWMEVTIGDQSIYRGPYRASSFWHLPAISDGAYPLCVTRQESFEQSTTVGAEVTGGNDPIAYPVSKEPVGQWPWLSAELYGHSEPQTSRWFDAEEPLRAGLVIRADVGRIPEGYLLHSIDINDRPAKMISPTEGLMRLVPGDLSRGVEVSVTLENSAGQRARLPVARRTVIPPPLGTLEWIGPVQEGAVVTGAVPVAFRLGGAVGFTPQSVELVVNGRFTVPHHPPVEDWPAQIHEHVVFFDASRYTSGPMDLEVRVTDGWGRTQTKAMSVIIDHSIDARPTLEPAGDFSFTSPLRARVPSDANVWSATLWLERGPLQEKFGGPYVWAYPAILGSAMEVEGFSFPRTLRGGGPMQALVLVQTRQGLAGSRIETVNVQDFERNESPQPIFSARPACELPPVELQLGCHHIPKGSSPARTGRGLLVMALLCGFVVTRRRRRA